MAKAKPDHREQIELKLSNKEREFIDDWQLRRSFATAGNLASDAAGAVGQLIAPFTTAGDAGLLAALIGSYVLDNYLDERSDEALLDYLGGIHNIFADKQGVIKNGVYPFPSNDSAQSLLIAVDPNGYGPVEGEWDQNQFPPNPLEGEWWFYQWGETRKKEWLEENYPYEPPAKYGPARYPENEWARTPRSAELYARTEHLPNLLPWYEYHEGHDGYSPTGNVPTLRHLGWGATRVKTGWVSLWDTENANQIIEFRARGSEALQPHVVVVWNTQEHMQPYIDMWTAMSPQDRLILFLANGGKPRQELDSLKDLLNSAFGGIPGAGVIEDIADFATPEGNPTSGPLLAAVQSVIEHQAEQAGNIALSELPKLWPVIYDPPKSIYKLEGLHKLSEAIKLTIPWYFGIKFAIQATSAVGELLPL